MASLSTKIRESSAMYPATAVVRNHLASNGLFKTRYCEYYDGTDYHISITLFSKEGRPPVQLFCVNYKGVKNITIEKCFVKVAEFLDSLYRTQGVDEEISAENNAITMPMENAESSKAENVIITGAEDSEKARTMYLDRIKLTDWSCTEKFYEFTDGDSAVMNRWFPLDSIKVTTADSPSQAGGLLKAWTIPEALFKGNMNAINTLPVRGFVLGKFDLEFKLVLQTNPFQACCVMLGVAPYAYGLYPIHKSLSGFGRYSSGNDPSYQYSGILSYLDLEVAVQRPHVLLDVAGGGEATIDLSQKYHKTLLRNFDYGFVSSVNPGIRGSNMGVLTFHIVSDLRVGTGNENHFNARIFYRFKEAKLTAMSEAVSEELTPSLNPFRVVSYSKLNQFSQDYKEAVRKDEGTGKSVNYGRFLQNLQQYQTQGPVMSLVGTARGVIDVADQALHTVEDIGKLSRKGFSTRNRDKPNDCLALKVIPRPRANFQSGDGIDDALVLSVGWTEMTQFFERFPEEPQSFKDFMKLPGLFGRFIWSSSSTPGDQLFRWNVHPTISPDIRVNTLAGNILRTPLSISSSMFTNYCGTIELFFQFVKTSYHKGAVEVAIHFGRLVDGTGLKSSYVKVLNIQECNGFNVTVPYIYDTPVRLINGTSIPMTIPGITGDEYYALSHTSVVSVTVINELSAPNTVSNVIEVLVWMKAGEDFGLVYPRAANTVITGLTAKNDYVYNPVTSRKFFGSPNPQPQYSYASDGTVLPLNTPAGFVVQGEEEDSPDFNQGKYEGNKITSMEHVNFKTLLKMPICILSNLKVPTKVSFTGLDPSGVPISFQHQAQIYLPVTCINNTLLDYLRANYYTDEGLGVFPLVQSVQNQITGMFGMYRGGMIYTIVIKKGLHLHVGYLPHDYKLRNLKSGLISDNPIITDDKGKSFRYLQRLNLGATSFSGTKSNLSNQLVNQSFMLGAVNPCEKYLINMSSQNNWLLINRQCASSSTMGLKTMRENSEWFNGHLVLWNTHPDDEDVVVDIYMNCADDFELGGFLGHVGVSNPYAGYALADNWRTQGLDFKFKDVTRAGWQSLKRAAVCGAIGLGLGVVANNLAPEVGSVVGAIAIYSCVGAIPQMLEVKRAITYGQITVEEVSKQIDEVCDSGVNVLIQLLQRTFPFIATKDVSNSLWIITQNVVHSALSRSWTNCAFAMFCVLKETHLFTLEDWTNMKDVLLNFVMSMVPESLTTQSLPWEALMDIIIGVVATKFQVQANDGIRNYLGEIFYWGNYKHLSGLNTILSLTKKFYQAISAIVNWAIGEADPNVNLLKALQKQDANLAEFMEEANLYLNSLNDNDFKRKDNRVRFLHTILRAFKLRLILMKIANPPLTNQLLALCNKVIDKANKQRYLFKCDIIKTEPFVVGVVGEPNIGKSFSVFEMATDLLKSIGYQSENPDIIFTVPTGVDYWNGYADQPVIWYDDWCNLRDEQTMRSHISQLYALKTSAPFNVPRAELENKEQVANPHIIFLTSNDAFPRSTVMSSEKAVYRRRDVLVRFSIRDGKGIHDFSLEEKKQFQHLEVQFYDEVTDPNSLDSRKFSFRDFQRILADKFAKFYKNELENKNAKYKKLMETVRRTRIDNYNLENPFDLIENTVIEDETLLTSDLLSAEVERLLQLIKDRVELSEHEVGDKDIFQTQSAEGDRIIKVCRIKDIARRVREWVQGYRRSLMICENCHESSHKHGTVIWCPEGAHYMCFHCALLAKEISVGEEDEYGHITGRYRRAFQCATHCCPLEIKQKNMFQAVIAEFIYGKVSTVENFYNLVRGLAGKSSLPNKVYYSLIIGMKLYLCGISALIWTKIFNRYRENFSAQGYCEGDLTSDQRSQMSEMLNHDNYSGVRVTESDRSREFHDLAHSSKQRYVCQHSMLINGFTYAAGQFNVLVNETDDIMVIEDGICATGKCVLTNVHFLEMLLVKFQVSPEYIDKYFEGNENITRRYFPRFLWPRHYLRKESRLQALRRLLAQNWWEYYVSPIGKGFMDLCRRVLPVMTACGLLWGSYKISKLAWRTIKQFFGISLETEAFAYPNGSPRKSRRGRPRTANNVFSQQHLSENFENKLSKIASNYILIRLERGAALTCWGVYGSTFVAPKHLVRRLKSEKRAKLEFISKPHENFDFLVESLVIEELDTEDLAIVTFRNSKVLFKDCRAFIPSRRCGGIDYIDGLIMDVDCLTGEISDVDIKIFSTTSNVSALDVNGDEVLTRHGLLYNYERKGMCGSLVCVDSQFPVLAIHVSGSSAIGRGIGVLLFREFFPQLQGFVEIEDTGEDTVFYGEDCVISYEASISRDMVPHIPSKTNIVLSLIDPLFEEPSGVRPAFLHPSEEGYLYQHSPLFYGIRKNGRPTLDFPLYYRQRAFAAVSARILDGVLIRKPTVLSVEEAVIGLPSQYVDDPFMNSEDDEIYYGPIPLDTSAGWPYSTPLYRKEFGVSGTSKAGWITFVRDNNQKPVGAEIHPKVLEDHDRNMMVRRSGLAAVNVFQDCLKDEKRPVEKVFKEGGTRLFSMSNVEGTIALRRYTLDFTSFLRYNRLKNGIAVGVNPDSAEWTILAEMLLKVGNNIFTLDFSNFGAGLNFDCGMMFGVLLKQYYLDNSVEIDDSVVDALMLELMGSRHVVGNLIYRTYAGSPSGAAITVEINSFVHLMYAAMSWLIIGDVLSEIHGKSNLTSRHLAYDYSDLRKYMLDNHIEYKEMVLDDYLTNVVAVVYGDDGLYSVSDEFKEVFNAVTINLVLKEHRIGVTDATKSEKITKYCGIKEATFLKRSFVPNELMPSTMWAAAIDWNSVAECVRWVHKKPLTLEAATRENCESSLLLAWGHGRDKYETWRIELNKMLAKVGLRPILLSWEEVAKKFYPDMSLDFV